MYVSAYALHAYAFSNKFFLCFIFTVRTFTKFSRRFSELSRSFPELTQQFWLKSLPHVHHSRATSTRFSLLLQTRKEDIYKSFTMFFSLTQFHTIFHTIFHCIDGILDNYTYSLLRKNIHKHNRADNTPLNWFSELKIATKSWISTYSAAVGGDIIIHLSHI